MRIGNSMFGRLALLVIIFSLIPAANRLLAQDRVVTGKVVDKLTREALASVSILVYKNGNVSGSVSNNEGGFRLVVPAQSDSVKFSLVGYHSQLIMPIVVPDSFIVALSLQPVELSEVRIESMDGLEIIKNAIAATKKLLPEKDYENDFFYREIIKDEQNYFSVAEAIFTGQFRPSKKDYKLKLDKGRSKEDVTYTRLFEDFHPGGGPQAIFEKNMITGLPDFLNLKKISLFNYHKDSIISFEQRNVYVVSFDQKPSVREALDKGKIYIDADDFSVINYESSASPLGIAYVKDLTGTDKLFAELLHIDFKRKGWTKNAEFIRMNDKLYLRHAFAEYSIAYKEPKKDLDVDLTITTELVAINQASPVMHPISEGAEWKRKNIVANLPTDFDPGFWGNENIISPTTQINNIIDSIGIKNQDAAPVRTVSSEWQYFGKNFFVAYQNNDSICVIPIMKGSWEDEETAGMLYQPVDDNFLIQTELIITKRSNLREAPDNGFQQAGIIVRSDDNVHENSFLIAVGTGGNSNFKYFLRKTDAGRSKGPIDKIDSLHQFLRIEKKGNVVTGFVRSNETYEWKKIAGYTLDWLNKPLQVGLIVMARFVGNGPKMKPDLKAMFVNTVIKKL
jgi:hypothetical protein